MYISFILQQIAAEILQNEFVKTKMNANSFLDWQHSVGDVTVDVSVNAIVEKIFLQDIYTYT